VTEEKDQYKKKYEEEKVLSYPTWWCFQSLI
jgi:hypothetical protein